MHRSAIWIAAFAMGCSEHGLLGLELPSKEETDTAVTESTSSSTTTPGTSTSTSTTSTTSTTTSTTSTTSTTTATVPLPACTGGSSWRDTLPPLPLPAAVPPALQPGPGVVINNCEGDPSFDSDPSTTESFSTVQSHDGGLWYFEAKVAQYTPGWSMVSVFASPSESYNGTSYYGSPWASAGHGPSGPVTVSVAVDLDAGHAWFYEDGALVSDAVMSLDPGVGAFRAALTSMIGNEILMNLGREPFVFDPPAGFEAWSSDAVGSGGPCLVDPDVPAPPAPIAITGTNGYPPTTFLSDATDPDELVLLGHYEPSTTNGVVDVTVNRTTPVTLALVSYEPTEWNIVQGTGANIVQIVVLGYENQRVTGAPVGVPVSIGTYVGGQPYPGVCGYQWPHDTGGCDLQAVVDFVEEAVCLPLKLYGGSYASAAYTVD